MVLNFVVYILIGERTNKVNKPQIISCYDIGCAGKNQGDCYGVTGDDVI